MKLKYYIRIDGLTKECFSIIVRMSKIDFTYLDEFGNTITVEEFIEKYCHD